MATAAELNDLLDQFESACAATAGDPDLDWHKHARLNVIASHLGTLRDQVTALTDPNRPVPQPTPEGGADARIAELEAQLAAARQGN